MVRLTYNSNIVFTLKLTNVYFKKINIDYLLFGR